MRVLHVERRPQADGVLGAIVGEDDRAHRGLARTGLAHQQHLLLAHFVVVCGMIYTIFGAAACTENLYFLLPGSCFGRASCARLPCTLFTCAPFPLTSRWSFSLRLASMQNRSPKVQCVAPAACSPHRRLYYSGNCNSVVARTIVLKDRKLLPRAVKTALMTVLPLRRCAAALELCSAVVNICARLGTEGYD